MAVIEGGLSGALQEVDPAFLAARVSERPLPAHSWKSVGLRSGLLADLPANATILSLRNLSANLLLVRRMGLGVITTAPFDEALLLEFALYFARVFAVSDSGGLPVAITGIQASHRTSLVAPSSIDLRIANSTAISAGSRVLDDVALARVATWSAAAGETIAVSLDNLIKPASGMYPIVLAQNEGLVLQNIEVLGANGIVHVYLNLEFAEIPSF